MSSLELFGARIKLIGSSPAEVLQAYEYLNFRNHSARAPPPASPPAGRRHGMEASSSSSSNQPARSGRKPRTITEYRAALAGLHVLIPDRKLRLCEYEQLFAEATTGGKRRRLGSAVEDQSEAAAAADPFADPSADPRRRAAEAAARRAEDAAAAQRARDEAAARVAEEEAQKRRAIEEEASLKRAVAEEEARQRQAAEAEARRKAAEEEARQRQAAEEEARRKRAAEEEARQRQAAEEEARRKRAAEEEAQKRRVAEEVARKAEEAAARSASASSSASTSAAGPDDDDDDDDNDDDCVFLREDVGKMVSMPHARFDCRACPLAPGAEERHCERCWCGVCQVPVRDCQSWAEHCTLTRAAAADKAKQAKQANVRAQLAAPRPPPPLPGSEAVALMADPRWGAMRFTVLSYIENCSRDEDAVLASACAVHDVEHEVAARVLRALLAVGDVLSIDSALWLRADTSLAPPPPPVQPPAISLAAALSALAAAPRPMPHNPFPAHAPPPPMQYRPYPAPGFAFMHHGPQGPGYYRA